MILIKNQEVFENNKKIGIFKNCEYLGWNEEKLTSHFFEGETVELSKNSILLVQDKDSDEEILKFENFDPEEIFCGTNPTFIRIVGQIIKEN